MANMSAGKTDTRGNDKLLGNMLLELMKKWHSGKGHYDK